MNLWHKTWGLWRHHPRERVKLVLGGLFLPLKPGITGLTPVKIVSGGVQTLKINVYNAPWLKENAFKDQEIGQGPFQIPSKVIKRISIYGGYGGVCQVALPTSESGPARVIPTLNEENE